LGLSAEDQEKVERQLALLEKELVKFVPDDVMQKMGVVLTTDKPPVIKISCDGFSTKPVNQDIQLGYLGPFIVEFNVGKIELPENVSIILETTNEVRFQTLPARLKGNPNLIRCTSATGKTKVEYARLMFDNAGKVEGELVLNGVGARLPEVVAGAKVITDNSVLQCRSVRGNLNIINTNAHIDLITNTFGQTRGEVGVGASSSLFCLSVTKIRDPLENFAANLPHPRNLSNANLPIIIFDNERDYTLVDHAGEFDSLVHYTNPEKGKYLMLQALGPEEYTPLSENTLTLPTAERPYQAFSQNGENWVVVRLKPMAQPTQGRTELPVQSEAYGFYRKEKQADGSEKLIFKFANRVHQDNGEFTDAFINKNFSLFRALGSLQVAESRVVAPPEPVPPGPTPPVSPSIELRNEQDKKLEAVAFEVAKSVREKGFGYVQGVFWQGGPVKQLQDGDFAEYASVGGFCMDKAVTSGHADISSVWVLSGFIGNGGANCPQFIRRVMNKSQPGSVDNQALIIDRYIQPTRREEVSKKGLFSKLSPPEYKEVNIDFNGFTVPSADWVKLIYFMPVDHPKTPRVGDVSMAIVVPPEVAKQIIEQTESDPLFMDALFKAMYPGLIDSNPEKSIRRFPATKLQILDRRQDPKNEKLEERTYRHRLDY